jgi:hypothetical protein
LEQKFDLTLPVMHLAGSAIGYLIPGGRLIPPQFCHLSFVIRHALRSLPEALKAIPLYLDIVFRSIGFAQLDEMTTERLVTG